MTGRTRRLGAAWVLMGAAHLAAARQLAAQAICSAPHSSPVLATGRGLHTLPPGAGWIQLSGFRQVSDRYFGTGGERQAFLAAGQVRTTSVFLTGSAGLLRGVDAWLQVPVHQVRYADQSGERRALGVGDPRLSLRVMPALAGLDLPLALRAGLKLPGREFPVDATIIPLSEGQRDWELSLESGAGLGRLPLYVSGWVGYRWRELNGSVNRKPGNERFAHLAAGGHWSGVRGEVAVELLSGEAPRYLGVAVRSATRRLIQLTPSLASAAGPGALEFTALVPLAGRNLPSGAGLSAGYRLAWGPR